MNNIILGQVLMGILGIIFAIISLWGVYQFTKPLSHEKKR